MNINLQTKQEQSSGALIQTLLTGGGGRAGGMGVRVFGYPGVPDESRRPALVSIDIRIRCTPRELTLTNSTDWGGKSADIVSNFVDYTDTGIDYTLLLFQINLEQLLEIITLSHWECVSV